MVSGRRTCEQEDRAVVSTGCRTRRCTVERSQGQGATGDFALSSVNHRGLADFGD